MHTTEVVTSGHLNNSRADESKATKPQRILLQMQTGDGEESYARNSRILQGGMLREIGGDIVDAVTQFAGLPEDGSPVRVADFGCSVGSNTLAWADLASRSVQNCYFRNNKASPEIQHFFTDLPSNDFNTLFQQLQDGDEQGAARPYYPAAVAGSFHGRLFPRGSLHIAVSIWGVHWVSKIPDSVLDISSPAYNRDRVWIDGGNPHTAQAYAKQIQQDLFSFFTHRAHELAPAGLLFLMCMCRAEHDRPECQSSGEFFHGSMVGHLLEQSWEELVTEGVIKPQERDGFNIPVIYPSIKELEDAINSTGAYNIDRLEIRRDHHWIPKGGQQEQNFKDHPESFGLWAKNFVRAVFNPVTEAHLDAPRALELWERLERLSTEHVRRTGKICITSNGTNYALVVLSRKC